MQEPVKAESVSMGDEILVDLGMGKIFRIVDKIAHDNEEVTITLYSPFGRRPKLTINKSAPIMRRL